MQRLALTLAGLALALAAGAAHALVCYTLYDRTDAVVYQGPIPPVDMSPEGDAERVAMRAAGQFLIFVDAENCPGVEYRFGDAGTKNLSIENIISDIRPMSVSRPGIPSTGSGTATPGRAPAPRSR